MATNAGNVKVTSELESLDLRTSGKLIAELSRQAAGLEIFTLPGDGRKMLVHNFAVGSYDVLDVAPPPRTHVIHSVDSFVAIAEDFQTRADSKPRIWHGKDAVVLICDDDDRRDSVRLPLPASEPLSWLWNLKRQSEPMNQGELIRVLRLKLGQPSDLVAKFRKLDFSAGRTGKANVEHGKESLGREIIAEVNGVDALPDVLNVSVRITDVPGANSPQTVRVGLEIDAQREEFYLSPMPGELDAAIDRMHADLHDVLSNALPGLPVYYGSP
jgi:hypothetical protein